MSSYSTIMAKAKRYGDSKRGRMILRFFESASAIRIEVQDADLIERREVTKRELVGLKADEQIARLCDLIHEAINAVRRGEQ